MLQIGYADHQRLYVQHPELCTRIDLIEVLRLIRHLDGFYVAFGRRESHRPLDVVHAAHGQYRFDCIRGHRPGLSCANAAVAHSASATLSARRIGFIAGLLGWSERSCRDAGKHSSIALRVRCCLFLAYVLMAFDVADHRGRPTMRRRTAHPTSDSRRCPYAFVLSDVVPRFRSEASGAHRRPRPRRGRTRRCVRAAADPPGTFAGEALIKSRDAGCVRCGWMRGVATKPR